MHTKKICSFSEPEVHAALKVGESKGAINEDVSVHATTTTGAGVAGAAVVATITATSTEPEALDATQLPPNVQQRLAMLTSQNAYLEEMQRQLKVNAHAQEAKHQLALESVREETRQALQERNQMQGIILELQDRLSDLDKRHSDSRRRLTEWDEIAKQFEVGFFGPFFS